MTDGIMIAAAFFILLGIAYGSGAGFRTNDIKDACDKFGAISVQDTVYECSKRSKP